MTMTEVVLYANTIVTAYLVWRSILCFTCRERMDRHVFSCRNRLDDLQAAAMRSDASIAKISEDVDKRTAP